jgi:hypothetical protein
MVEEKKNQETNNNFELVKVPIQTEIFIRNNKTEEILDDKMVLLEMLNILKRLEGTLL